MEIPLILLFLCRYVSPVRHSLHYFLTATSGLNDFPEFVGSAAVDEILIGYCDSNMGRAEPKHDWIKKMIKADPEHLQHYSQKCSDNQHIFRSNIRDLGRRLNQTTGPHVLQRMNGCEWDNETGEIKGFNQYGFDGEDSLILDLDTLTWVAPRPQLFPIKRDWDADKKRLDHNRIYYESECPKFLKKYIHHGGDFLLKTVSPSVRLLQENPSVVRCHATGFYPRQAYLFWRKDGEEVHEGVEKGEILPNHDESFQMTVLLNVQSIEPEEWSRYDCVFEWPGLKHKVVTKLDKEVIWTNQEKKSTVFPIVGGVIAFILVLGGISFLLFYLKKARWTLINTS